VVPVSLVFGRFCRAKHTQYGDGWAAGKPEQRARA
jgi:hypothetical protein